MPPALVPHYSPNGPVPSMPDRLVAANSAKKNNKQNTFIFLLPVLGALFFPYSAALYAGDLKLTPIKILILLLIFPALSKFIFDASQRRRRLLASDACALGVFLTMSLGPLTISGSRDFVAAFSQGIEFYGVYVIARAFIFDDSSVRDLVRSLQIVTLVVVALGILDIVFQRYVTLELSWLQAPPGGRELDPTDPILNRTVLGISSLRATSTFDHPILFGTFCAAVVPLHFYAPMSRMRRFFLVMLCVTGCMITLSSAPLLALFAAFTICFYDLLMKKHPWRWKLLISTLVILIATFSLLSNNPLSWLFRNLTLDPQTAYFRLLIWDAALDVIGNNPWVGIGFNPSGNLILDSSTDSLWLAKSLRYGMPMTALMYLAPMAATIPIRGGAAVRHQQPFLDLMCTAFSMTLAVIMFISISTSFWNASWLFFALCIAVRTSLKERCLLSRRNLRTSINGERINRRRASASTSDPGRL